MMRRIAGVSVTLLWILTGCSDSGTSGGNDIGIDDTETESESCEGEPGSYLCSCQEGGICESGFVCDEDTWICHTREECEGLQCTHFCQTAVLEGDDYCTEACEPGFIPDIRTRVCLRDPDATCIPGDGADIGLDCEDLSRECVSAEEGAYCGECFYGYIRGEASPECEEARYCLSLNCQSEFRACQEYIVGQNAHCSECLTGYVEQGDRCVADSGKNCGAPGTAGSIVDECNQLHRECIPMAVTAGANCGSCHEGWLENPETGQCVNVADGCSALDCDLEYRDCEDQPFPRCTTCMDGYVQDRRTGQCRAILQCVDLNCSGDQVCEEAADGLDAYCRLDICGDWALWDARNRVCVPCPPCNRVGENGIYPRLSHGTGKCICRTMPGYFYWEGSNVGTFPCDKDGDGWVRDSARYAILEAPPDSAISVNARCDLRTIDRFVLKNDAGSVIEVVLPSPVHLFEPIILDDDYALGVDTTMSFPLYGIDAGRRLTAGELNPLTKACVDIRADFNQNGVSDVLEYQEKSLSDEMSAQEIFNQFSYFLELHRGRYIPPDAGSTYGSYLIQEQERWTSGIGTGSFPPVYDESLEPGNYWQRCVRYRDQTYDSTDEPIGMDFASYGDVSAGMNHHSQFKCLVLQSDISTSATVMSKEELIDDSRYVPNICEATPDIIDADGEIANPRNPALHCRKAESTEIQNGTVMWAAVTYQHYKDMNTSAGSEDFDKKYEFGCVNECAEFRHRCPGEAEGMPLFRSACVSSETNFGKLICGCRLQIGADHYGDEFYRDGRCATFLCPQPLAAEWDNSEFSLATRSGFWLCGEIGESSATARVTGGLVDMTVKIPGMMYAGTPMSSPDGQIVVY